MSLKSGKRVSYLKLPTQVHTLASESWHIGLELFNEIASRSSVHSKMK